MPPKQADLEALAREIESALETMEALESAVSVERDYVRVSVRNPLWDGVPGTVVANLMRIGFLAKVQGTETNSMYFFLVPKRGATT